MSTSNKWLSPLQRSYDSIKSRLIESMKSKMPEITDFSEGNIFIKIISLFSAIAEGLHYYIDNMGRETFFITARRYTSLQKHLKLIDYEPRSAMPSMVDIVISRADRSVSASSVNIPLGTTFIASNGMPFISTRAVTWVKGTFGVTVPVMQKEIRDNMNLGQTSSENMVITFGDLGSGLFYVEGSMNLKLNNESWQLVTTFAHSNPTSKHYKVILGEELQPLIIFGNGRFGMKPPIGSTVTGTYYVTYGASGNLPANSITSVPQVVSQAIPGSVATNVHASVGGSNYEDFNMLKEHAPLSIKTLGVAITEEDYRDLAMLTDGVAKAYVDYICGKFVKIYITPDGGGIAPQALIESTYKKILSRKVITTNVEVLAAGVSPIVIDIDVTGRPSFRSNDINDLIVNTLMTAYSYQTSDVGKAVRVSDIYSLIDNLSMVDHLTINNLFLKPWPIPQGSNTTELNISFIDVISVNETLNYKFTYLSTENKVEIRRDGSGQLVTSVPIGEQTLIDDFGNQFAITISNPISGAYSSNSVWTLSILPNNTDQILSPFVIPVFNSVSDITSNITEIV